MKKKNGVTLPKVTQLPSGSWHCRIRINGKDIYITKDTEKEAVAEAMAVKAGIKEAESKSAAKKLTLAEALDNYIEQRRGFKSPSTIYAYESYRKQRFQSAAHSRCGM